MPLGRTTAEPSASQYPLPEGGCLARQVPICENVTFAPADGVKGGSTTVVTTCWADEAPSCGCGAITISGAVAPFFGTSAD